MEVDRTSMAHIHVVSLQPKIGAKKIRNGLARQVYFPNIKSSITGVYIPPRPR